MIGKTLDEHVVKDTDIPVFVYKKQNIVQQICRRACRREARFNQEEKDKLLYYYSSEEEK